MPIRQRTKSLCPYNSTLTGSLLSSGFVIVCLPAPVTRFAASPLAPAPCTPALLKAIAQVALQLERPFPRNLEDDRQGRPTFSEGKAGNSEPTVRAD